MVRRFPWQCSVGSLSRINYHLNYTPISYVVILFTYICYHTRDIAAGAHCHNGMVTHIFVYPGYVNTNYRTSAARAHRLDILSHAFKVQINMCHPYNNNKSFEFCLHKGTLQPQVRRILCRRIRPPFSPPWMHPQGGASPITLISKDPIRGLPSSGIWVNFIPE